MLEFDVLGPLTLRRDGQVLKVSLGMSQRLLALLLCHDGRPVTVDGIVDEIWGRPPQRAKQTLQVYVHRLRRLLVDPSVVEFGTAGYRLRLTDGDRVDAHIFHRLVAEARAAETRGDFKSASLTLSSALGLWRGLAYSGIDDMPAVSAARSNLEDARVAAMELRFDAELELGRHTAAVAELARASAAYPYREKFRRLLMLALYRSGRSSEALEEYRKVRAVFAEELGIEPGAELQELHLLILEQDPGLLRQRRVGAVGVTGLGQPILVQPFQLPAAISGFAGREAFLRRLDDVTVPDDSRASKVVAITGLGGIGKTALVIHWSHRAAQRFPDGQLYLNLRGYHPNDEPVTVAEAMRQLLAAFNIPANLMPSDVESQVALYRSLVAGKRILLVLDNARDAEQVRSLLPGASGCTVLVTSRSDLAGLVVTEGATPIPLEVLTVEETETLLAMRLGRQRIQAEAAAVPDIARGCAGLPLAVSIVAARAAILPDVPLSELADQLGTARTALDLLNAGDAVTDIRSVFSWSYRALSDDGARLFRLLGLHPGPHIDSVAASRVADLAIVRAEALLAELMQANLVEVVAPGRYQLHDLVRGYALEVAQLADSARDRRSAIHRTVNHYVDTAGRAALLIDPQRDPLDWGGTDCAHLKGEQEASRWLAGEEPVLLRVIELANRERMDAQTWHLAWAVSNDLQRRGHWGDWLKVLDLGYEAAQRLTDPQGCSFMCRFLGAAYLRTGRLAESAVRYEQSIEFSRMIDHPLGEALAYRGLSAIADQEGQIARALELNESALRLVRLTGSKFYEASTLNGIAWEHYLLGDAAEAVSRGLEALTFARKWADLHTQAVTLHTIGAAYLQLAEYDHATAYLGEALELNARTGDQFFTAVTLDNLADVFAAKGDTRQAAAHWQQAANILDELGHARAEAVRAKLATR